MSKFDKNVLPSDARPNYPYPVGFSMAWIFVGCFIGLIIPFVMAWVFTCGPEHDPTAVGAFAFMHFLSLPAGFVGGLIASGIAGNIHRQRHGSSAAKEPTGDKTLVRMQTSFGGMVMIFWALVTGISFCTALILLAQLIWIPAWSFGFLGIPVAFLVGGIFGERQAEKYTTTQTGRTLAKQKASKNIPFSHFLFIGSAMLLGAAIGIVIPSCLYDLLGDDTTIMTQFVLVAILGITFGRYAESRLRRSHVEIN